MEEGTYEDRGSAHSDAAADQHFAARGLLAAAASGQKAVLLEHLDRRITELKQNPLEHRKQRDEMKRLNENKQAMAQMKAGITVPLVGNDRVIGFLNLWDERVPEAFASDEIALVLEIAEQMGIVVENSKLYERMREVGEAVVAVTFAESQGRTLLTLRQLFPSKAALEGSLMSGMEHGMRVTLDQLDELVASMR